MIVPPLALNCYRNTPRKVGLRTRLNSTGGIRLEGQVKSDISHQAFSHVSAKAWNSLPAGIRQSKTVDSFKVNLRQWIEQNIEIE